VDRAKKCCLDGPAPTNDLCDKGGQPGECIPEASCTSEDDTNKHWVVGLCKDKAGHPATKCCLTGPGDNDDMSLAVFNPKPVASTINSYTDASDVAHRLTPASNAFQAGVVGTPGSHCLTQECVGCGCSPESSIIRNNLAQVDLGPFTRPINKAYGSVFRAVMDEVRAARPDLFWGLKTDGAMCCRAVKLHGQIQNYFSNHAYGFAIDVYYGTKVDAQGDNKTQRGLLELAAYMNAKKIYWGAAFGLEDSMHFEASKELIVDMVCAGMIEGVTSVHGFTCPAQDVLQTQLEAALAIFHSL